MGKFNYTKYDYSKVIKKIAKFQYVITGYEYNLRRDVFGETEEQMVKDYIRYFKKHNIDGKYKDCTVEIEFTIITPEKIHKFYETNSEKK